MGASEITARLMISWSKVKGRLFRNNTGSGWTSNIKWSMPDGSLVLKNPRPLKAGLVKGGSDTIGWTPIVITREMIDLTLPVFTAIEIKGDKDRPTKEQLNFIDEVNKANGIGFFQYEDTDPLKELVKWKQRNGCL